MIPSTSSAGIAPDSSAHALLQLGRPPFVEFPRYSILELQNQSDFDESPVSFSEWLTRRLQIGKPFVIQDFDKLHSWDSQFFDIEKLIELSTKKNIPIRNCGTGRDLSFTLRKFADAARLNYQEFQNLYARDLQCPQEWQEQCRRILPTEVQWGGRLDLFQWLPQCARSEVMMAYVGSEGSSSGFHRCFSSTVALNLLVDSDDRPVVCIGTDFESQKKYDAFMSARGISPHVDWQNLPTEELLKADFPLYVYDQKIGDLVVFPPATAHQVWNPSTLSTKLVWNILHPLSLEVGFQYVQPPFNRLCHPDVARTNLSLACAMLSLVRDDVPVNLPPDLPLLSRLFRQMLYDESIDGEPATPISVIRLPETVIATCNFCGTAIWNRHVRCSECTDFDLCLACYLSGRSCEHSQSYSWAELVPQEMCTRILTRAREILGFQLEESRTPDRRKTLGTAVNDLMKSKQTSATRLCHLCRIEHPDWKGRRCDKCTAFFCFRGLYRHLDFNSADVMRHAGLWSCPKCTETCNCRCCHFATAYVKAEKPASKKRVKPADSRGKVMGFTDNVFDQRRGQRNSNATVSSNAGELPSATQITSRKRDMAMAELAPQCALVRKHEAQTPEIDFLVRPDTFGQRPSETSDYLMTSQLPNTTNYRNGADPIHTSTIAGAVLPSIKTLPEQQAQYALEQARMSGSNPNGEGMKTLASAAMSRVRMPTMSPVTPAHLSTLPPILVPNGSILSGSSKILYGEPITPSSAAQDPRTRAVDEEIMQLEERITKLRQYGDGFLQLKLEESFNKLSDQLATLEAELQARKKEKSAMLIEKLEKEFPGLADVARKEAEELGYA